MSVVLHYLAVPTLAMLLRIADDKHAMHQPAEVKASCCAMTAHPQQLDLDPTSPQVVSAMIRLQAKSVVRVFSNQQYCTRSPQLPSSQVANVRLAFPVCKCAVQMCCAVLCCAVLCCAVLCWHADSWLGALQQSRRGTPRLTGVRLT